MDETQCKVGDDYYLLTFSKGSTNGGTKYEGHLLLDSPLEFQYLLEKDREISSFKPAGVNPDIITAIKDAIENYELNQGIKFGK
jgi:hypothetical protein